MNIAGFDGFQGANDHYDALMDTISDSLIDNSKVCDILREDFDDFNLHFLSESMFEDICS